MRGSATIHSLAWNVPRCHLFRGGDISTLSRCPPATSVPAHPQANVPVASEPHTTCTPAGCAFGSTPSNFHVLAQNVTFCHPLRESDILDVNPATAGP